MVHTIEPNWTLRDHELADGGYLAVYQLSVDTDGGTRRVVLKASPDGDGHGIDTEARLLRILNAHTSIPVPEVYGAVDTHDRLPAPFYVMEHVPGRAVERTEMNTVSPETLETVARSSGRYLAELHGLDAVESYGFLTRNPETTLRGERPPASFDQVVVAEPESSWPVQVRNWADDALRKGRDSRFEDLVPELRPVLHEQLDVLDGTFEPVLCHVDNSLENVLHDPETGAVTAMLDWAFTLAATPAYDLVLIEESLNGGQWQFVPSAPDNSELIRNALLDGYSHAGSADVLEQLEATRELYELLSRCRSMHLLQMWPTVKDASPEEVEGAAAAIRADLESYL
ncbi:phosphotransferase family protein [Haloglomus litoreum]|uniref:phosphotransferase family protein n=1 Tax=Haloglomus litoreum TaxID=3034026 RepID=UPI0023E8893A|nr:phosphotransferase [Haloglomus sp. DT116]